MTQKFLQNFKKKRSYIRESIQQIPMRAATPFEQKILNGLFESVLLIIDGFLPMRWVEKLRIQAIRLNRNKLRDATALRRGQLCFVVVCLLCFILETGLSSFYWNDLIPKIQLIITYPSIVTEYLPNRINPPNIFFLWLGIPLNICATGMAIIILRLKNFPLLFNGGMFCLIIGAANTNSPLWYVRMPVLMWMVGRVLLTVLVSAGTVFWLLCAVWTKKWSKEYPNLFLPLPIEQ